MGEEGEERGQSECRMDAWAGSSALSASGHKQRQADPEPRPGPITGVQTIDSRGAKSATLPIRAGAEPYSRRQSNASSSEELEDRVTGKVY
jgi:hypothetical protein